MYFIEAAKNLYAYLFLGQCRRHGCDLITVEVNNHYASTMPVCVECHPQYSRRAVVGKPSHTIPAKELVREPLQSAAPELTEVEVG